MTFNRFYELGEEGRCPSCFSTNLKNITHNSFPGSWKKGVVMCQECGGFPFFCGTKGIISIKRSISDLMGIMNTCDICGEYSEFKSHGPLATSLMQRQKDTSLNDKQNKVTLDKVLAKYQNKSMDIDNIGDYIRDRFPFREHPDDKGRILSEVLWLKGKVLNNYNIHSFRELNNIIIAGTKALIEFEKKYYEHNELDTFRAVKTIFFIYKPKLIQSIEIRKQHEKFQKYFY